jgi:hypothetical protein
MPPPTKDRPTRRAPPPASAQVGPGGSSQGASGSTLQGLSYSRASWDNELRALPAPSSFFLKDDNIGRFLFDDLWGHSFRKDVVIFCYSLRENLSATEPFVLEPTRIERDDVQNPKTSKDTNDQSRAGSSKDEKDEVRKPYPFELCTNQVHSKHKAVSLVMGRYLVFRIDMNGITQKAFERIQTLNINVTNQAGTSFNSQRGPTLNPATTRPGTALMSGKPYPCPGLPPPPKLQPNEAAKYQIDQYRLADLPLRYAFCPEKTPDDGTQAKIKNVYYLMWPGPLLGDTIPSISINLVYTPVPAALAWKADTFYPAGTIVSADNGTGHYYLALGSGVSSDTRPHFGQATTQLKTFHEDLSSGLTWKDAGEIPPKLADLNTSENKASTMGASANKNPTAATRGNRNSTAAGKQTCVGDPSVRTLWKKNTCYEQNVWVDIKGKCYQAATSGSSGEDEKAFSDDIGYPNGSPTPSDGSVHWDYRGPCVVSPTPIPWSPNTAYAAGAVVVPPGQPANAIPTGHYYQALSRGVSGPIGPAFPVDGTEVSESDGIYYMDAGTTPPATGWRRWQVNVPYKAGDTILDARTGHYYTVVQPGISGPEPPKFSIPDPKDAIDYKAAGDVEWQDLGATLPAGTSIGSQPADQTLNVLNLSLPQTQVLSYFNLASGVVMSSLKPPSISSYPANASTGCPSGINSCTIYTSSKGSHLIDPVLGVTVYAIKPLDAERPFKWTDTVRPDV